jgi:nucleoside-diphosphate-sugar epimerase
MTSEAGAEMQPALPTRVLVTGAAGALGRHVVSALHRAGVAVSALVLEPQVPAEWEADRVVVGDGRDVDAVRRALVDVDAVIHLAAIPSPRGGTAEEVFCGNTGATFTVLEEAAGVGVRWAVIASSHALTGLPFAEQVRTPAYLPVDEAIPPHIEDPYALSKQVDEETASMMWWRHGLSVCALRFPFLGGTDDRLPRRAQQFATDPAIGARDLWGYLDYRDAADTCVAAISLRRPGRHVVTLAAPLTLAPYPTEQLLDAFYPHVPRTTRLPGRSAPFDLTRARALLDFSPQHLWPVEERELVITERHS